MPDAGAAAESRPPARQSVPPLTGGSEPKDEQLKTLMLLLLQDLRTNSPSRAR